MAFGDEGKGSFVDYLARRIGAAAVVRYNGGSQASHTVVTAAGETHRFAQLGSASFLPGCRTVLSANTVVNPDNLIVETAAFSRLTGVPVPEIVARLRAHEDCLVVTPYHKLLNRLRELSLGGERRGSVGSGVSEAPRVVWDAPPERRETLSVRIRDVAGFGETDALAEKLSALRETVTEFYAAHKAAIERNLPPPLREPIDRERAFLFAPDSPRVLYRDYVNKFRVPNGGVSFPNCVIRRGEPLLAPGEAAVFEGAQGLLLDRDRGIRPNTTCLDTSAAYAKTLSAGRRARTLGAVKAFYTRHGPGVFPTESSEVAARIRDENQDASFWNGAIRFGWFDSVLLRYAQRVNGAEALCVSALDCLGGFESLSVAEAYTYEGPVDAAFERLFSFSPRPGGALIRDILQNGPRLGEYLRRCRPLYRILPGWREPLAGIRDPAKLPPAAWTYLRTLEALTGLPVAAVSVGPTAEDKLALRPEYLS